MGEANTIGELSEPTEHPPSELLHHRPNPSHLVRSHPHKITPILSQDRPVKSVLALDKRNGHVDDTQSDCRRHCDTKATKAGGVDDASVVRIL